MTDFSARQLEFRERLSAMLAEYAEAVGPAFDGDIDEGIEMEMPHPVGWVIVVDWEDIADSSNLSTVSFDSGIRTTYRMGLLQTGLQMAMHD